MSGSMSTIANTLHAAHSACYPLTPRELLQLAELAERTAVECARMEAVLDGLVAESVAAARARNAGHAARLAPKLTVIDGGRAA